MNRVQLPSVQPQRVCSSFGEDVWQVTPRGLDELARGSTRLSGSQLELLVRIDGRLPMARLQGGMRSLPPEAFEEAFRSIRDQGLISPVEHDPFELRIQAGLNSLAAHADGPDVDASLVSLRQSGYFVSIARPRGDVGDLPAGVPVSAVVVEDEPVLARFIKSYLAFDGIQARVASCRNEIVVEFNRRPLPDIVLLDVALPDVDGFDVLRRMRAHSALKQVPVIMLTGKATRESVLEGMESGADGYVTKPFEADAMMRAVRTVLGLTPSEPDTVDPWSLHDARPRQPSARRGAVGSRS
jgi:two-component system OmpR family response regulator